MENKKGRTIENAYNITDISDAVKRSLNASPVLNNFFLKASVKDAREYTLASGAKMLFLTLIETIGFTTYEASATMDVISYSKKKFSYSDIIGKEITMIASLDIYIPRTQLQFNISEVQKIGDMSLDELAKEKLILKLKKENLLMTDAKRKPLPRFPKKIAIITGKDSAAYNDVKYQYESRYPFLDIINFPTIVQGENAVPSIISQLDEAEKVKDLDFILITRGGGSKTDLAPFDDERLVLRITKAKYPIITAIGHEIDNPICELVADYYFITPTAAAQNTVPHIDDIYSETLGFDLILQKEIALFLNKKEANLNKISNFLKDNNPTAKYQEKIYNVELKINQSIKNIEVAILGRLDYFINSINYSTSKNMLNVNNILNKKINLFERELNILNANNPKLILEKGYHEIKSALTNKKIKSIKDVNIDDDMITTLKDGIIISTVKEKKRG